MNDFTDINAPLTDVETGSVATGDFEGDLDLNLLITEDDTSGNLSAEIYTNDPSATNVSPIAEDDSISTQFDQPTTFSVTGNNSDDDGTIDVATVDLDPVTDGQQTTFTIDEQGEFTTDREGNVTFTPETGFTGDSTIPYTVKDDLGTTSEPASITVTVEDPSIVGTTGRDTLEGIAVADTLDGGEGNDILMGSLDADSLIGGEGIDRVVYGDSTAAVTVDLLNNTATGGDADGDTFDLIENLDGSRFSDVLKGDNNDNRIYGNNGNDNINGSGGADYLSGQNGDDKLSGGAGQDRLLGGNGNDILSGGIGNDILDGGNGADRIRGANTKTGGVGEIDRLIGSKGADTFILGNKTTAFYNDKNATNSGIDSYALISDFDVDEDVIRLSSANSQTYYLAGNPYGTSSGTGIYLDNDGTNDELVGLLEGVNNLTAGAIDGNTQGFSLV